MYLHYLHYIHKYINLVPPYQAIPALICVRSYNFATSQARTLVFMRVWLSLVMTNSANHALNRRAFVYTLGTHPGGRGCACAPAFFLYYVYPLHNFFHNVAPKVGRCLCMVTTGGQATHAPMQSMVDTPIPPCKSL